MQHVCMQQLLILCLALAVYSKTLIANPQFISPSRKLTVASLQESSRAIVEHELNSNSESVSTQNANHVAPVPSSVGENNSHHEDASSNLAHSTNENRPLISSVVNRDVVSSDTSSSIVSQLLPTSSGASVESSVERFVKPILSVDQPISSLSSGSIESNSAAVSSASESSSIANVPASSVSSSSMTGSADHSGLSNNLDVSNTHYQTLNQPAVTGETGDLLVSGADSAAYNGLKTRQPNVGNKLLPVMNSPYQPTYAIYNPQTGTYTPYAYPSIAFAQQPAYAPVIYASPGYVQPPSSYPVGINYPTNGYPASVSNLPTATNYPNFGFVAPIPVANGGQAGPETSSKPNESSGSFVNSIISQIPFIGYNPISYMFGSRSPQPAAASTAGTSQSDANQQPSYIYPNPATGYYEPVYANPSISQPSIQPVPGSVYQTVNSGRFGSHSSASNISPSYSSQSGQVSSGKQTSYPTTNNSPSLVQRIGGFLIRPITYFTSSSSSSSSSNTASAPATPNIPAAPKEGSQIVPNQYTHMLPSEPYDLMDLPANEQYHAPSRNYARSINAPINPGSSVYPQPISMPQYAISYANPENQPDVASRNEAVKSPSNPSVRRSGPFVR